MGGQIKAAWVGTKAKDASTRPVNQIFVGDENGIARQVYLCGDTIPENAVYPKSLAELVDGMKANPYGYFVLDPEIEYTMEDDHGYVNIFYGVIDGQGAVMVGAGRSWLNYNCGIIKKIKYRGYTADSKAPQVFCWWNYGRITQCYFRVYAPTGDAPIKDNHGVIDNCMAELRVEKGREGGGSALLGRAAYTGKIYNNCILAHECSTTYKAIINTASYYDDDADYARHNYVLAPAGTKYYNSYKTNHIVEKNYYYSDSARTLYGHRAWQQIDGLDYDNIWEYDADGKRGTLMLRGMGALYDV